MTASESPRVILLMVSRHTFGDLRDSGGICKRSRSNPLATRAVFSFTGFAGVPERHLYLHHVG
jgi:hypothetical protein